MEKITFMLNDAAGGNEMSADALLPLVYNELRNLAHAHMAQEASGHTLQPTALVHEAWLRLAQDDDEKNWKSRSYFFAAAATAMRRILVEHARKRAQLKRGGGPAAGGAG